MENISDDLRILVHNKLCDEIFHRHSKYVETDGINMMLYSRIKLRGGFIWTNY